jgi:hypothetical protein
MRFSRFVLRYAANYGLPEICVARKMCPLRSQNENVDMLPVSAGP